MCKVNVLDGQGAVLFAELEIERGLQLMNLDERAAKTVRVSDGAVLAVPQRFDKAAMFRINLSYPLGSPDYAVYIAESVS